MGADEQMPPTPPPWKEKFIALVNEKIPNSGVCKECNQKTIAVSDDMVVPPVFVNGGVAFGGPNYPQIMLVCTNCGNTRFFNAVVVGAMNGSDGVER